MRVRILTFAAVAVLVYFAYDYRADFGKLPDPTTAILNLRNPSFRFALHTMPDPPTCDTSVRLEVHAIDAGGQSAEGLTVQAYVFMNGMEGTAQEVTLHGKGGGNYEGRVSFEWAGTWEVDVTGTKAFQHTRQRLSIEVQPAPPGDSGDRDDSDS
jgi:hypothetical protein